MSDTDEGLMRHVGEQSGSKESTQKDAGRELVQWDPGSLESQPEACLSLQSQGECQGLNQERPTAELMIQ